MESSKKCTKCGEVKPLEDFYKDKSKKDGRESNCKLCRKAYHQANKGKLEAYKKANKDNISARAKAKYQANREPYKAYLWVNRGIFKECSQCEEVKPLEEFYKKNSSKDGRKSLCECCEKAYHEANKDKRKAYYKAYHEANKDKRKAYNQAYHEANKDKRKVYNQANKDKIATRMKAYKQENKDKMASRKKAYREANREKINAHKRAYRKERYNTDNYYRMTISIRKSVSRWKNGSTIETIGISFQEFADMYGTGEGMHLDHKIPMSWFDVDNADHNKVCQHHTNLQWLTPEENLSKRNLYADVNGQKVLRKDFDLEAYVRNMLKKLA
jgi:hypothetical protein